MYSKEQLLYGIKNPTSIAWELSWAYHRFVRGQSGVSVIDRDWDSLIILDACRYDIFESTAELDGTLQSVVSKGSNTEEFLRRNFSAEAYPETVYVSANPQVQNHGIDHKFADRVRLWETHWDEDLRTVPPKDVVDAALAAHERHPKKRLIVHFVQPHYPFIGPTGRKIEHGTLHGDGVIADKRDGDSVWRQLERGDLDRDRVYQAYVENLELTLPHVETLLDRLNGRAVVTSDHGNALGRWGLYGHPYKRYTTEVVKVPWLVVDGEQRRTIEAGEIQDHQEMESTVEERLHDLGYR